MLNTKLFRVKNTFKDTTDKHICKENDIFPHSIVKEVSPERVKELLDGDYIEVYDFTVAPTDENEVVETFPKHTGGGYYELSNGEKVQGKENALAAEEALKAGE